jgi:putative membrane protein
MLRRNFITTALLVVAAAAIGGCEQNMNDLGGKPSPELPIGESHFMKVIANANQQQVQLNKIALKRSQNSQVRQYAQLVMDDHIRFQDQLQSLASSKGAELPKVLGNMEQGMVNDLASTTDSSFDKTYIDHEITALQDEVNTANAEAMNGADLDLKAFAQKILPTLQHHVVLAKELQQGGNPVIPPAGQSQWQNQPSNPQ